MSLHLPDPFLLPSLSSSSRLEILSTITEIRGPLRIQGWPNQTFPYLRNLRRVGHPNGTTLNLGCNDGQRCEFSPSSLSPPIKLLCLSSFCADDYSLVVALNPQLRQLDLSSLETIGGGGLFFFNNPQLCYVGNFSTYLDNPTAQHQCVVSPFRKDPQTCCECAINHHTVSRIYIQKLTE